MSLPQPTSRAISRHMATVIAISVLAGCAAGRGETNSDSSRDVEIQVTGPSIPRSELEARGPVEVLSKAEFVEWLTEEVGLPQFDEDTECDEAVAELEKLGFEVSSVTRTTVDVKLPDVTFAYRYYFENECSAHNIR